MKCEIKYIKNSAKKDYKSLTLKSILGVVFISSLFSITLNLLFSNMIVNIILAFALLIIIIAVWINAVDSCNSLKKETEIDQHHENLT